jgi:hypothetical protein
MKFKKKIITRDQKKLVKQENDTCHVKREVEKPNKTKGCEKETLKCDSNDRGNECTSKRREMMICIYCQR